MAIRANPKYGHIICRCETVSEGEIIVAIHGNIPATTVDAVKRRTRSGMGRCQGGFCGPRVIEILARELGIPAEEVTKRGKGSELLWGRNRVGVVANSDHVRNTAAQSKTSVQNAVGVAVDP